MPAKATTENNMAATHPEFAAQFHPTKNGDLTPETVLAGGGGIRSCVGDGVKSMVASHDLCRACIDYRPGDRNRQLLLRIPVDEVAKDGGTHRCAPHNQARRAVR